MEGPVFLLKHGHPISAHHISLIIKRFNKVKVNVSSHFLIIGSPPIWKTDSTVVYSLNVIFCILTDSLKNPSRCKCFMSLLSDTYETSGAQTWTCSGPLQVWNSNAVKDEFMGQVVLTASAKDSTDPQMLQLRKSGQQMADEMPGSVSLRVVTATQLIAIWARHRQRWMTDLHLLSDVCQESSTETKYRNCFFFILKFTINNTLKNCVKGWLLFIQLLPLTV